MVHSPIKIYSKGQPSLGSELFPGKRPADFSTDYSEANQTIEFRLVEDANLTAHFQPVDYNVSVALSTIDYFDDGGYSGEVC